jgi:O-antigen/teichoic acid export membrane protein
VRTFSASVGAKGFSIACTFIQVPLALHYLGAEGYGFWVTLIGIGIFMNFSDLGLGVGLQNVMSIDFADQRDDHMRQTYFTGAICLALLGLAVMAISLPLVAAIDWAAVFKIHDATVSPQVRRCLALTIIAFAAGFPLNATARLVAATQMGWIHGLWIALGSAIALGFTFLAIALSLNLTAFIALSVSAPLIQGVGMHLHMMKRLNWRHRPWSQLPRKEWREFLGTSFTFSAPQIAGALMNALPPVALSTTAGPVAAAGFNVLQRLYSPLTQGHQMFVQPFWPAFTEAIRRGDLPWIRRSLVSTLLGTGIFLAGLAGLALASEWLLHLWVGAQSQNIGRELRLAVAVWLAVVMAGQPLFYFLLGAGRLTRLAIYGTIAPLLAITLLFALGHSLGATTSLIIGASVYGALMWTCLASDASKSLSELIRSSDAKH